MEAVFGPTLSMITQDFAEFPEHRVGLYRLLRTINLNCFPGTCFSLFSALGPYKRVWSTLALLTLPPDQFKLFMVGTIGARL